jgi:hypothetical protein
VTIAPAYRHHPCHGQVSVLEKRATFSRVNILTLWPQTADDLMGFGAKLFYPRFTNHGDLLHLGTRERHSGSSVPFTLLERSASPASPDHPNAWGSPTQPRAPPLQRGGVPRPRELA